MEGERERRGGGRIRVPTIAATALPLVALIVSPSDRVALGFQDAGIAVAV